MLFAYVIARALRPVHPSLCALPQIHLMSKWSGASASALGIKGIAKCGRQVRMDMLEAHGLLQTLSPLRELRACGAALWIYALVSNMLTPHMVPDSVNL